MNKLLSAVTVAAAALTGPAVQASEEDWKDDHAVIFHSIEHKSCLKAVKGQRDMVTMTVEVIAIKDSWDKAAAGKSDAEKSALRKQILAVGQKALNEELRPRLSDFSKDDIDAAYDMDREQFTKDPYRNATRRAYHKAQDEILKQTGIEVMIGVDSYPVFTPNCVLK